MADGGERRRQDRFHGRMGEGDQQCSHPGCMERGEFRAPGAARPGFDGPGRWRWFCLDHIRAFNAAYNFFDGMTTDEIEQAQRPFAGWERETRAFSATAAAGAGPRWGDFIDPLDAINARFAEARQARPDGRPLADADRHALKVLGLAADTDRKAIRKRYTELVRRYHPDRNGGDRSHEKSLQDVISAYTHLKTAAAFA